MNLEWEPEAEVQLQKLVCIYHAEGGDLRDRFISAVENAAARILQNPETPRIFDPPYRRVRLAKFPYFLIYLIEGETIWMVSIVHQHRHPDFWKKQR